MSIYTQIPKRGRAVSILILAVLAGTIASGQTTPEAIIPESPADLRYPLAPFDQVSISIYGQPDLSVSQRISDSGAISMPLIGEIDIAGLTLAEAKEKIAAAYIDQEYLRAPVVTINLESFSTKSVTVIGEVGKQGEIQLPVGVSQIEIQRLIALAGGFSGIAKRDSVRIERRRSSTSEPEILTVDVDRILNADSEEAAGQSFMVKAGDIVIIPRRIF